MLIIHYTLSSRWEIDHEQVTCQRKLGSFSRGHLTWSQLIGPSLKSSIIAFVVLAWLFSLYSLLVNNLWVHDPPTSTDTSDKAINQSSRKKVEQHDEGQIYSHTHSLIDDLVVLLFYWLTKSDLSIKVSRNYKVKFF